MSSALQHGRAVPSCTSYHPGNVDIVGENPSDMEDGELPSSPGPPSPILVSGLECLREAGLDEFGRKLETTPSIPHGIPFSSPFVPRGVQIKKMWTSTTSATTMSHYIQQRPVTGWDIRNCGGPLSFPHHPVEESLFSNIAPQLQSTSVTAPALCGLQENKIFAEGQQAGQHIFEMKQSCELYRPPHARQNAAPSTSNEQPIKHKRAVKKSSDVKKEAKMSTEVKTNTLINISHSSASKEVSTEAPPPSSNNRRKSTPLIPTPESKGNQAHNGGSNRRSVGNPQRFGSAGCCEEEGEEVGHTPAMNGAAPIRNSNDVRLDGVAGTQPRPPRGMKATVTPIRFTMSPQTFSSTPTPNGGLQWRKAEVASITSKAPKKENMQLADLKKCKETFIDSHCHLDFIFNKLKRGGNLAAWRKDFPDAFPDSFEGCIPNFIEPALFVKGLDKTKFDKEWIVEQLQDPLVLGASYGCHPHWSESWNEDVERELADICERRKESRIVAIGECGLDFYKSEASMDTQMQVFAEQLKLATHTSLPVIIHCRSGGGYDAEEPCLRIMVQHLHHFHSVHRHCYTENWSTAQMWMRKFPNVVFGFTNVVLGWNQESPQFEAFLKIPLDRIVLETDAPYFRPAAFAIDSLPRKVSLPGMAITVAGLLAQTRGIPLEEVMRATSNNTRRVYILQSR